MSNLRVFVEVSDNYLWTLKPFAYYFNIYWSTLQPVIVAGYKKPDFQLPPNFKFHQIAPENYPADKWSDGMINFLSKQDDRHFILLLCDYWLCRTVDMRGIDACYEQMTMHNNVLRFDLTDDRQYAGGVKDIGYYGSYDIVETPHGTPYQMSLQAAIWNKKLLLDVLKPGMSAWETEIHLQPPSNLRVMGTRQRPVRYANAVLKGRIDYDQLGKIPKEHYEEAIKHIPKGWENNV